jgi:DNA anti-recombination protein RmuC
VIGIRRAPLVCDGQLRDKRPAAKEQLMSSNDFGHTEGTETHTGHKTAIAVLAAGLVIALAGDGYLMYRAGQLNDEISRTQNNTQTQISKLNEATTTLLQQEQQRLQDIAQQMKQEVKGVSDSANLAIKRARTEAQKQDEQLSSKIAEAQQQVSSELSQFKDTTTSKFTEVATDVSGVKANVESVKANVASAQSDIDKTGADLKRVMGDMGVMSGLIATNSKDLVALRALGERNYYEFDLSKKQGNKRVGDIVITLKKADTKHNRYTMDVLADDKHVEKKDRTINEPVQLYVGGMRQPYEIVVNRVEKDKVVGYLSTPKVKTASR